MKIKFSYRPYMQLILDWKALISDNVVSPLCSSCAYSEKVKLNF